MFLVLASGMNYTEQQVHLYKVFFFFFRQSVLSGLKDCSRKLYSAVIPKFFWLLMTSPICHNRKDLFILFDLCSHVIKMRRLRLRCCISFVLNLFL